MKTFKVYDGRVRERCPKCGSTLLELVEDGQSCIICGLVKYLPASVVAELDKTRSLRLHRVSGKEVGL